MNPREWTLRQKIERPIAAVVLVLVLVWPAAGWSSYWAHTILLETFIFGIAAASLVFLSAYGRNGGLYVYEQREAGFIVRDSAGTSGVRFSWRIVCKRADVEGARFQPASAEARGLNVQRIPQPQLAQPSSNERPR